MKPRRGHKQDQLAKLYDAEILPLWAQRFGRMILRGLSVPPKASVLDVGCGTGYPALDVLKRMDEQGRIIAIDPASPLLDVARVKAGGLSGKRIFFRSEAAEPRLSFADDVYDLVLANCTLEEVDRPPVWIAEFARVCKPNGRVMVTLPLAGTFAEFYDLFREVLVKRDRKEALARLDHWLERYPTPATALEWLERAGLTDGAVEHERFTLLFKSSREFFFAPLIEHGPLPSWKKIAGKGQELQDVFWHIKEAIDTYYGTRPFSLTVNAACLRGRKPTEEELRAAEEARAAAEGANIESDTPMPLPAVPSVGEGEVELPTGPHRRAPAAEAGGGERDPNDPPTGEIPLGTGEIVVVDEVRLEHDPDFDEGGSAIPPDEDSAEPDDDDDQNEPF